MIPENSDIIALTAQADIDRLYKKVIQPALAEFVPENAKTGEEAKSMDEFLEAARIPHAKFALPRTEANIRSDNWGTIRTSSAILAFRTAAH